MSYRIAWAIVVNYVVLCQIFTHSLNPSCHRYVTKYRSYITSSTRYSTYKCGWWNRRTCYRSSTDYSYVTETYSERECCPGYSGAECKLCPKGCSGEKKECTASNTCTCIDGWTGADCLTAVCTNGCGRNINKECTAPNTCTCIDGWKGANCLTAICTNGCGRNKECIAPNNCTCVKGWGGVNCLKDINECLSGKNLCEANCNNTDGSYLCHCENVPNSVIANDGVKCLGGVTNASFSSKSHYSLTLSWSPPINYTDDGEFSSYKVACSAGETRLNRPSQMNIETKFTSFVLLLLMPFTKYNCCILAEWTTNGIGPAVCIVETTLEDGITVPADAPQNISIIPADSQSVLIQWDPPSLPNGLITKYKLYVDYTNGSNIDLIILEDGNASLYLLENLNAFQFVGVSLSATTIAGEGPASSYLYNRSGEMEPGHVHYLQIDILSNTTANISWHPPIFLNGIIISYHLHVSAASNSTAANLFMITDKYLVKNGDHQFFLDNLEPFIPYMIGIAAVTRIGKGELVTKTFFTLESIPKTAPVWSTIERVSATELELEWEEPLLLDSRGFITEYFIKLAASVHKCFIIKKAVLLSTYEEKLLVNSLIPNQEYCVSIAAATVKGVGLFSEWELIKLNEIKNVSFYINGIKECISWIEINQQRKLNDFLEAFIAILKESCHNACFVSKDYIYKIHFICFHDHSAVIELFIIKPTISSGNFSLEDVIDDWINAKPTVLMDGVPVIIDTVCYFPNIYSCNTSSVDVIQNQSLSNDMLYKILIPILCTLAIIVISLPFVYIICKKWIKNKMCDTDDQQMNNNSQPACKSNECYEQMSMQACPHYEQVKNPYDDQLKHTQQRQLNCNDHVDVQSPSTASCINEGNGHLYHQLAPESPNPYEVIPSDHDRHTIHNDYSCLGINSSKLFSSAVYQKKPPAECHHETSF